MRIFGLTSVACALATAAIASPPTAQQVQAKLCTQLKASLAAIAQYQSNATKAQSNCNGPPGCTTGQKQDWQTATGLAANEIAYLREQIAFECGLVINKPKGPVTPSGAQVVVTGWEVTQAVQDLGNSVPLIAGKQTWARIYLSPPSTSTINVILKVDAGGTSTNLTATKAVSVDPDPDLTFAQRRDFTKSVNIQIPAQLTSAGTVTVSVVALTDASGNSSPYNCVMGCDASRTLTFYDDSPARIQAVGMSYNLAGPGQPVNLASPRPIDYALLQSWLGRAYPAPSVTFGQRDVTFLESDNVTTATAADIIVDGACTTADAQLAAIRALDIDSGADERTHYIGLVYNAGGYMRGCSNGVPATADPSVTASEPVGAPNGSTGPTPIDSGGDTDASFGDWYGGHELGHTFGRAHPGFCNGNSKDDLSFPYPSGQISNGMATSFAGLDVGDPTLSIAPSVIWVTDFDIMTYCDQPQWLSAYTYEAVRQRLLDENPGVGGFGAAPALRIHPGERALIRYPVMRQRPLRAPVAMMSGSLVHVVCIVNLTRATARFAYVNPVTRAAPVLEPSPRVTIVVRSPTGAIIATLPAPLHEDSDTPAGKDHLALVDAAISLPAGAAQLDLLLDNAVVATYRPPSASTEIRNLRAEPREQSASRRLLWDGPLLREGQSPPTYIVQTSLDGQNWETIAVGLKTPSVALSKPTLGRRVRVITSNGFTRSAPVLLESGL